MADRTKRDIVRALSEARSLLQDLQNLGLQEVEIHSLPEDLPPCKPQEVSPEHPQASCRPETLEEILSDLGDCRRCPLCQGREKIVFGVGTPHARVVFVGEAPGREEDEQGEPFVGEAGRLLDRILFAMELSRNEVYICNVEKCRPPGNRDPQPEEIAACEPFLKRQIAAIRPQVIVSLGRVAAQALLRDKSPIGRLRGQWREYEGIALMPTYHPAYLLRNPESKRQTWEDMKQVLQKLRNLEDGEEK